MDTCLDFAYVSNYLTFKIFALQRDPLIYKFHTHIDPILENCYKNLPRKFYISESSTTPLVQPEKVKNKTLQRIIF